MEVQTLTQKPAEPEGMKGQQQGHVTEEVLVEDITNQLETEGEEEEMTETMTEGHPTMARKERHQMQQRSHSLTSRMSWSQWKICWGKCQS
jgi:hypothetical protein